MAIQKLKLKKGIRWEVCIRSEGRESARIRKRFERRTDAEEFVHNYENEQKLKAANPFKDCAFDARIFKDEAEYCLNDGELRFSASHLVRVKAIVKDLLPKYGEFTMDKFTPELLTTFQQNERAKGLAQNTLNRKTEVIMSIINFSVRHRRIPFSPAEGFRKLKPRTKEMSFWDLKEAESFLSYVSDLYPRGSEKRWVYAVYLLALNTAMRAGEIWGLKPMDLSTDGSTLKVRRQFSRVVLDYSSLKGGKSQLVPCNPYLHAELIEIIRLQTIRTDQSIFLNEKRKPICHENFVRRQFQKDLASWGGRKVRFHDLRHTAATLLIANGIDVKTVKEICGHADIRTTMNYVHLVKGAVEQVASTFGSWSSERP